MSEMNSLSSESKIKNASQQNNFCFFSFSFYSLYQSDASPCGLLSARLNAMSFDKESANERNKKKYFQTESQEKPWIENKRNHYSITKE